MTMSRTVVALSALVLLAAPVAAQIPDRSRPPEVGPPPPLALAPIERRTLSNGLTVLYMGKHEVPLVQVNLVLRVGSAADPADAQGVASMTAAMLDEGAGDRDALALGDAIEFLGAGLGIGSDHHSTTIRLHVPVAQFTPALALLADVALRPRFDAGELDRQRRQRITSLLQARDQPNAIAARAYDRALFGDTHPYGRLASGDAASLQSMTRDHLVQFHRTWFVPNNAALIVVGDIALDALMPALERAFGGWRRANVPTVHVPTATQVASRTVTLVNKPEAAQSAVRIGRIGVARDTEDYYALTVLNTILGGSFTSRLNTRLREEKGYAYGANSGFAFRQSAGPFTASSNVQTAVTDSSLYWFMHELHAIGEPVPEDELARARNYVALRFPGAFQSVAQVAGNLETLWQYNLPLTYFNTFVQRILAVTQADVQRVARQYLDPERMAIVIVGDQSVIEAGVRGLNLGPMRVLSVEDVMGAPPTLGTR
jgi:predicted Zn-dependent peptidase